MSIGIKRSMLGLCAVGVLVALVVVSPHVMVGARSLLTTTETVLVAGGLVSLVLAWSHWSRSRDAADLLALVAVLALALESLEFAAAPALVAPRNSTFAATAWLATRFLVAAVFAAAVLAPRNVAASARSRSTTLLALVATGVVGLGLALLLVPSDSSVQAVNHSVIVVPAICLLVFAGAAFLRSAVRQPDGVVDALLGAAAMLLAAAWTYNLVVPGRTTSLVAGSLSLRVGALGLILVAAFRVRAQRRRAEIDECVARERRRLAGLLHDGMAQDLALIAAYAPRLARDLGTEHPVAVAARRALAAARGAIIDLSASDTPTATDALRAVADELARRHGVRIEVDACEEALAGDEREAIVRIMREAIVNAVRHGKAKNITVSLRTDNKRLTMTIDDDGCGLGSTGRAGPQPGYGLREMNDWARQLGGQLTTQQGTHGGTAVRVTVS